jgi:tetratricopeptide (TPR) repeat protein
MTPKPGALFTARLLIAAGALAGCAGKLPPCPAAGGPTWRELTSAHFRVRTDADPETARGALRDLEQFQSALLTVFRAAPDMRTGQLPVIVVGEGWDDFSDPRLVGWFSRALFQPLVVMRAESQLGPQEVIKHELLHYLSAKVMPIQPRWLAEGLASYFETLEYDPDRGEVTVGRPPPNLLAVAQNVARVPFPELLSASKIDVDETIFYASAWAAVHFLMNRHADELLAFEEALHARVPVGTAFPQAFGKLTPDDLDAELRDYLDGGKYSLLVFPFAAPTGDPVAERPMSDAEVHTARAQLLFVGRKNRAVLPGYPGDAQDDQARVRGEIDEALRLDPGSVEARAIAHFELHQPVDVEAAKRATEASPRNWMAWLLLSEALHERQMPAQYDLARKALDLAWEDPSVTINLVQPVAVPKKP